MSICKHCTKDFKANRPYQIYCRHQCREAAYNKRNAIRADLRRKHQRETWTDAQHVFENVKGRARYFKKEFLITLDDVVVPKYCPILQIPLFRTKGRATDNSPSLDRIDNSKGYIPGNVRVISNRANTCKTDLSLDAIKRLYEYSIGKI